MSIAWIYDPTHVQHNTGDHVECAARIDAIRNEVEKDERLANRLERLTPAAAAIEDIERCHDPRMVRHVQLACVEGHSYLDPDTRIERESFDVASRAAGAAIKAVDFVMGGEGNRAFALTRPPGHHATSERAMGFCLFNNAAIAARYAQKHHGVERVLIVDWDVHHGNGTQDIFWTDPSVFYLSTHQYPFYPGTGSSSETGGGAGEGYTLNVPLSGGTSAREHREAFTAALAKVRAKFTPDLVIVSAGFDAQRGDPLGGLMLENQDFYEMTGQLLNITEMHNGGRLIGLLEGGYNLSLLGGAVRSHLSALL